MIEVKFVQFISINGSINLRVLMRCFRNVAGGYSDGDYIGTFPVIAATTGDLSS